MTELVALRSKTYSYLMDDGNSDKKGKGTKNASEKEYVSLAIIKTAY